MIRLGAFAYLHKSASFYKLNQVIQKAIDTFELNILEKQLEEEILTTFQLSFPFENSTP
ncbi:MAG: hypothetical protein N3A69_04670 [Leptospiraceae bacterium]|nr:hypothetical protein [Leptospiraceae bacterium]